MVDETLVYRETKTRWFWNRPSRSLLPVRRRLPHSAERKDAPDDSAVNARRAAGAMLIAFALFLIFESQGLRRFTRDLPGNAVTDVLVRGADGWHGLMERLGPARVQPAVREVLERVRAIHW
jgi:hypothetical protein